MQTKCSDCGYEWDAVDSNELCPRCNMPEVDDLTEEEIEDMYREALGLPPATALDEPF